MLEIFWVIISTWKKIIFREKRVLNFKRTKGIKWNICKLNVNYFFLLPHWGSYVFVKKIEILMSHARFSDFKISTVHKRLKISSWNLVQQWSSHASSIVTIFMQTDAQSKILWDFELFEKYLWWLWRS